MKNSGQPRLVRAFSLVELLVAVGLLAVIMIALMMAFQQTQRAMHLGLNQVDVLENGRAIMNLISRDLQEVTYSETVGSTNFYARPLTAPTNMFGPFESALHELFFLVRTNNEWISIKYTFQQSHWDPQFYGVGALYRKINPPTTNYLPVTNILSVSTSNVVDFTGLDNDFDTAFHRVADGIVHFRVQVLNTIGEPFAATNSPDIMVTNVGTDFQWYYFANTNLPAFIDIEIGILEPQTLREFDARLAVNPAAAKSYLAQRSGKVHLFRQRIPVRSRYRTDS